jgi:hypothetical protein
MFGEQVKNSSGIGPAERPVHGQFGRDGERNEQSALVERIGRPRFETTHPAPDRLPRAQLRGNEADGQDLLAGTSDILGVYAHDPAERETVEHGYLASPRIRRTSG